MKKYKVIHGIMIEGLPKPEDTVIELEEKSVLAAELLQRGAIEEAKEEAKEEVKPAEKKSK